MCKTGRQLVAWIRREEQDAMNGVLLHVDKIWELSINQLWNNEQDWPLFALGFFIAERNSLAAIDYLVAKQTK